MTTSRMLLHAIPIACTLFLACDAPRDPGKTASTSSAVTVPTSAPPAVGPLAPPPLAPLADKVALEALDDESRTKVAKSPVPVLVPKRPELLAVGKVMADEHWYAFHVSKDGLTINVQATRIAHQHADIPPARGKHVVRGVPAFITQNEGIWTATWREAGTSYALDVECAEPTEARCATDGTLQGIANDLVFVGGQSAGAP